MADSKTPSLSFLADHVEQKRRSAIYNPRMSELQAASLDLSAMMAYVVGALDALAKLPAIAQNAEAGRLRDIVEQLKRRFEAHSAAMEELNRGSQ